MTRFKIQRQVERILDESRQRTLSIIVQGQPAGLQEALRRAADDAMQRRAITSATDLLPAPWRAGTHRPATAAQQQKLRVQALRRRGAAAIAPLQAAASGIVVFTQDWRVQRKLVEDGDRIEQEFVAETTDYVSDEALARLQAAIRPNVPIKASRQSEARLRFAGKRIRPGQLEELCAAAGLMLKSLRRLRIGKVALSSLPAGRWRYVKEFEHF